MSRSLGKSWFQRVAEGEFSDYSYMEKFGENNEITTSTDPEDVWDGGGIYTFSYNVYIITIHVIIHNASIIVNQLILFQFI